MEKTYWVASDIVGFDAITQVSKYPEKCGHVGVSLYWSRSHREPFGHGIGVGGSASMFLHLEISIFLKVALLGNN